MTKQKMKTKSAAKKRFKVTGTGKIVRHRSHTGHNTGKKKNSKMRALKKQQVINSAFEDAASKLLGKK